MRKDAQDSQRRVPTLRRRTDGEPESWLAGASVSSLHFHRQHDALSPLDPHLQHHPSRLGRHVGEVRRLARPHDGHRRFGRGAPPADRRRPAPAASTAPPGLRCRIGNAAPRRRECSRCACGCVSPTVMRIGRGNRLPVHQQEVRPLLVEHRQAAAAGDDHVIARRVARRIAHDDARRTSRSRSAASRADASDTGTSRCAAA